MSGRNLKIFKHLKAQFRVLSKCRKCAVLQEGFYDYTKSPAARINKNKRKDKVLHDIALNTVFMVARISKPEGQE